MTLAIPQNGSQNKFTITDTNYQNGSHKQIIATPKLIHIRSNKRYIAIFVSFFAFPQPRSSK